MELDYSQIGKRIAQRREELGLKQAEVCERARMNDKYLSCIERATSIPSLEVVMRLALALDTPPDTFLTDSIRLEDGQWRDVAEMLQNMNPTKLSLAKSFYLGLRINHRLPKGPSINSAVSKSLFMTSWGP